MNRVVPVLAFLLAGCSDGFRDVPTAPSDVDLAPDAAVVMDNQWLTISSSVLNTCVGETMLVSGKVHITSRIFSGANGLRIRGHTNLSIEGIGLVTGARYLFQQITNSDFEEDLTSGSSESTQVFHLNVISTNGAPDSFATVNGTTIFFAGGGSQFIPKRWEFFCR
jgi:hypothetical protein